MNFRKYKSQYWSKGIKQIYYHINNDLGYKLTVEYEKESQYYNISIDGYPIRNYTPKTCNNEIDFYSLYVILETISSTLYYSKVLHQHRNRKEEAEEEELII